MWNDKHQLLRKRALENLDIIRWATKEFSYWWPTDQQIWKGIWCKDFSRPVRNFLWKSIHGAYMIGNAWANIPNYEQLVDCPNCRVPETMEHILLECTVPTRNTLWSLAQSLWRMKFNEDLNLTFGTVLGCGIQRFLSGNGSVLTGKQRLFRILISETAFMIWKLRCERRIVLNDDPLKYHSEKEVHNRWVNALNTRLQLDCVLTNKQHFGRHSLSTGLILCTWSGTLLNESTLPENWIGSRVLVGIETFDRLGRNR
jgi:hypothetical protein